MRVRLYRFADTVIASSWSLEELSPACRVHSREPAIAVGLLQSPPPEPKSWINNWPLEAGGLRLGLSACDKYLLLRFPGEADFMIAKHGGHIKVWPNAKTGRETVRHLLLDQVLPRVLAQQERLVVHAGAIEIRDRAIAFMGRSGSGKSTLVASFHDAGYRLLCDDAMVLKHKVSKTIAVPTYASLRLWPESVAGVYVQAPALARMAHYSSKRRIVGVDTKVNSELPLEAIYFLEFKSTDAQTVSLSRLIPSAACLKVIGNSFQLDISNRRCVAYAFDQASLIAEHLPVFSLFYPRRFTCLAEVRDVILRHTSGNFEATKAEGFSYEVKREVCDLTKRNRETSGR